METKFSKQPDIENVKKVALRLNNLFKKRQFAFRGTTSLVFQGIDMKVQDIDIICDKKTATYCNKLLKKYLQEPVSYKVSNQFKSYFGKFVVDEILVEVYGEWQIKDKKGKWSEVFNASDDQITHVDLEGVNIPVTKVEIELSCFSKTGRWNAYHKILRQVKARKNSSQEILF